MAARMMSQERRKAPRVTEQVSLAILGGATELQVETRNISTTGAYCTMDQFIAPMTKLQVQLEVPNGARRVQVRGEGVVVRAEPVIDSADHGRYNIAIFFTNLTEHSRSVMRVLCASGSPAKTEATPCGGFSVSLRSH